MYFILALRVGKEKGKDEADILDCCPYLRIAHNWANFVIFDFFGEDSIRYYNRASVQELHVGKARLGWVVRLRKCE